MKRVSIIVLATILSHSIAAQNSPCSGATFRQFDFWLGDWTVENASGALSGTNNITLEVGGCVLVEHWKNASNGSGMSLNYLNIMTGKWNQKWVDDGSKPIELEGGLKDGNIVLNGSSFDAQRQPFLIKVTWKPVNPDYVIQTVRESRDKGATWTVTFEGHYKKKK